jgi:hypothetical protein
MARGRSLEREGYDQERRQAGGQRRPPDPRSCDPPWTATVIAAEITAAWIRRRLACEAWSQSQVKPASNEAHGQIE